MKRKEESGEAPAVPAGEEPAAAPGEEAGGDSPPELAEAQAEAARLRDGWLRAEAELANYRRRAERDREEAETRARDRVLSEVMALADDLERALDAAEQAEKVGPIYEGVHLVHGKLRDILRAHGIEVIDPAGQPFDPFEAEALLQVESSEAPPGTVLQVIEKGYRQGTRLLRPARVTVARARESTPGESDPA